MKNRNLQDKTQFICSICIPTYNRGKVLEKSLSAMTAEAAFRQRKVQIVLSDNASTDETQAVCQRFQKQYPDRIKYIQQTFPIEPHHNFYEAMKSGDGTFLKLQNDYCFFENGQLDHFISLLEQHQDAGDIFIPYPLKHCTEPACFLKSVNGIVKELSFQITSISYLCIKRSTFMGLVHPFRAWRIHFPQLDIIFRVANAGGNVIVLPGVCMSCTPVNYRANQRNNAKIFGVYYIRLLEKQMLAGTLDKSIFQLEKRRVLFRYIIPFHFDFFHQYNFSEKILPFFPYMKYYCREWYFIPALLWIAFYYFICDVIPLHQFLGKIKRRLQKK